MQEDYSHKEEEMESQAQRGDDESENQESLVAVEEEKDTVDEDLEIPSLGKEYVYIVG